MAAKLAGRHKTPQGELKLEQTFQMVKGTLRKDGKDVPVEGKVLGNEVTLKAAGREMRGTVKGKTIVLASA